MFRIKKYHESLIGEIALSLLAIVSVGLLFYEFSADLPASQILLLDQIDVVIASVFLIDFYIGLRLSDKKAEYWKHNWYILLASVPIPEGVFQSLRVLRILRLVRLTRVVAKTKKMKLLAGVVSQNMSRYIYVVYILAVVILTGATAFYDAEAGINPNISNFFDALWWACVTVTTVGYGDISPVTWEGRLVAACLMFFGVGLVGAIAGIVGGTIIRSPQQK